MAPSWGIWGILHGRVRASNTFCGASQQFTFDVCCLPLASIIASLLITDCYLLSLIYCQVWHSINAEKTWARKSFLPPTTAPIFQTKQMSSEVLQNPFPTSMAIKPRQSWSATCHRVAFAICLSQKARPWRKRKATGWKWCLNSLVLSQLKQNNLCSAGWTNGPDVN